MRRFSWTALLAVACTTVLTAQDRGSEKLRIATKVAPPFAMKTDDGAWTGITIELWRQVANELGLSYTLVEATVPEMLAGVESGQFAAAAAALTVTHGREEKVDFTHSYYSSGLGIAERIQAGRSWWSVLRRVFSADFFKALGVLLLFIVGAAVILWLLERKKNPEQFGGGVVRGLASAVWWSGVTMSTVGYGDKAPVTALGRVIGLVWIFVGVITISGLTGAIASVLTVSQLDTGINGPEDLRDVRVGTVGGTTSEDFLKAQRILYYARFSDVESALEALVQSDVDAVVHDAPLLFHFANADHRGKLHVLPRTFERQDYAIAVGQGSPLRERINRVLLRIVSSPQWSEVVYRFTGQ